VRASLAGLAAALLAACTPPGPLDGSGSFDGRVDEPAAAARDDLIFAAFKAEDFETIEEHRAALTPASIERMLLHWKQRYPWDVKNGYAYLLIHRTEPQVDAVMWDALDSPEPRVRAAAVATLLQRRALWAELVPGGVADVARIDREVAQLRSGLQ